MLTNYVLVALRNLRRQNGHSFIEIAELALGVACCLLIGLVVRNEFRYDGPRAIRGVQLRNLEGCMGPDDANYKSHDVQPDAGTCRDAPER